MKKLIAIALVMMLCISALSMAAFAAETFTVTVEMDSASAPYAWAWGDYGNAFSSWPGVPMTKDGDVWKIDVPMGTTGFTNQNFQTIKEPRKISLPKLLNIQIPVRIHPPPPGIRLPDAGSMLRQQTNNVVYIYPNFRIAFLLTFVKYQLQPKMQMHRFNVIDIFLVRVSGSTHKPNQIPCLHQVSLLQSVGKGVIFLQMGIIVITLIVKRTNSHAPAAITIPTHHFHNSALYCHNRRTGRSHQIIS